MTIPIAIDPGLTLRVCGWFISRGRGTHPTRTIADHELILVTAGRLSLDEDGVRHDLGPGEWLLLRPGLVHAGAAPYARDTAFIWLHFDPHVGGGVCLPLPCSGRASRPQRAEELARRILDERERPGVPPLLGDLLAAALLVELTGAGMAEEGEGGDEIADRAWRLLVLRFAEPLSTAGIARELGCHPDHLTRAYRRRFGHPPIEAMHRQRIAHARKLLAGSADRQEVIALASGYGDVRHFRRWFRRLAGVTPGEWRRLHGRVHVNTE